MFRNLLEKLSEDAGSNIRHQGKQLTKTSTTSLLESNVNFLSTKPKTNQIISISSQEQKKDAPNQQIISDLDCPDQMESSEDYGLFSLDDDNADETSVTIAPDSVSHTPPISATHTQLAPHKDCGGIDPFDFSCVSEASVCQSTEDSLISGPLFVSSASSDTSLIETPSQSRLSHGFKRIFTRQIFTDELNSSKVFTTGAHSSCPSPTPPSPCQTLPSNVVSLTREQMLYLVQQTNVKYLKYKGRYAELAQSFHRLQSQHEQLKLSEDTTKQNSSRRIQELQEQCLLERQAKAHLEEMLRMDIDEKEECLRLWRLKFKLMTPDKSRSHMVDDTGSSICTSDFHHVTNPSDQQEGDKMDDLFVECDENDTPNCRLLRERVFGLESQLCDVRNNLNEKLNTLTELAKNNENLKFENAELEEQSNLMKETHRNELDRLEELISSLRERMTASDLEREASACSLVDTHTSEMRQLQQTIQELEGENKQQLETISDLNRKVDSLEQKIIITQQNYRLQLENIESIAEEDKQKLIQEMSRAKQDALHLLELELSSRLDAEWTRKLQLREQELTEVIRDRDEQLVLRSEEDQLRLQAQNSMENQSDNITQCNLEEGHDRTALLQKIENLHEEKNQLLDRISELENCSRSSSGRLVNFNLAQVGNTSKSDCPTDTPDVVQADLDDKIEVGMCSIHADETVENIQVLDQDVDTGTRVSKSSFFSNAFPTTMTSDSHTMTLSDQLCELKKYANGLEQHLHDLQSICQNDEFQTKCMYSLWNIFMQSISSSNHIIDFYQMIGSIIITHRVQQAEMSVGCLFGHSEFCKPFSSNLTPFSLNQSMRNFGRLIADFNYPSLACCDLTHRFTSIIDLLKRWLEFCNTPYLLSDMRHCLNMTGSSILNNSSKLFTQINISASQESCSLNGSHLELNKCLSSFERLHEYLRVPTLAQDNFDNSWFLCGKTLGKHSNVDNLCDPQQITQSDDISFTETSVKSNRFEPTEQISIQSEYLNTRLSDTYPFMIVDSPFDMFKFLRHKIMEQKKCILEQNNFIKEQSSTINDLKSDVFDLIQKCDCLSRSVQYTDTLKTEINESRTIVECLLSQIANCRVQCDELRTNMSKYRNLYLEDKINKNISIKSFTDETRKKDAVLDKCFVFERIQKDQLEQLSAELANKNNFNNSNFADDLKLMEKSIMETKHQLYLKGQLIITMKNEIEAIYAKLNYTSLQINKLETGLCTKTDEYNGFCAQLDFLQRDCDIYKNDLEDVRQAAYTSENEKILLRQTIDGCNSKISQLTELVEKLQIENQRLGEILSQSNSELSTLQSFNTQTIKELNSNIDEKDESINQLKNELYQSEQTIFNMNTKIDLGVEKIRALSDELVESKSSNTILVDKLRILTDLKTDLETKRNHDHQKVVDLEKILSQKLSTELALKSELDQKNSMLNDFGESNRRHLLNFNQVKEDLKQNQSSMSDLQSRLDLVTDKCTQYSNVCHSILNALQNIYNAYQTGILSYNAHSIDIARFNLVEQSTDLEAVIENLFQVTSTHIRQSAKEVDIISQMRADLDLERKSIFESVVEIQQLSNLCDSMIDLSKQNVLANRHRIEGIESRRKMELATLLHNEANKKQWSGQSADIFEKMDTCSLQCRITHGENIVSKSEDTHDFPSFVPNFDSDVNKEQTMYQSCAGYCSLLKKLATKIDMVIDETNGLLSNISTHLDDSAIVEVSDFRRLCTHFTTFLIGIDRSSDKNIVYPLIDFLQIYLCIVTKMHHIIHDVANTWLHFSAFFYASTDITSFDRAFAPCNQLDSDRIWQVSPLIEVFIDFHNVFLQACRSVLDGGHEPVSTSHSRRDILVNSRTSVAAAISVHSSERLDKTLTVASPHSSNHISPIDFEDANLSTTVCLSASTNIHSDDTDLTHLLDAAGSSASSTLERAWDSVGVSLSAAEACHEEVNYSTSPSTTQHMSPVDGVTSVPLDGAEDLSTQMCSCTEHQYLRNIVFQYMMGNQQIVLAKVISAVLKFDTQQTSRVMKMEQYRQSLVSMGHTLTSLSPFHWTNT